MSDQLKSKVVELIKGKIKELDNTSIFIPGQPLLHLVVMRDVENLKLQMSVKTTSGPRFFLVTIQENH